LFYSSTSECNTYSASTIANDTIAVDTTKAANTTFASVIINQNATRIATIATFATVGLAQFKFGGKIANSAATKGNFGRRYNSKTSAIAHPTHSTKQSGSNINKTVGTYDTCEGKFATRCTNC
jgi:hypothetical protein